MTQNLKDQITELLPHHCYSDSLRDQLLTLFSETFDEAYQLGVEEGKKQEKQVIRQKVELWMDSHERRQEKFTTDDFIKFMSED